MNGRAYEPIKRKHLDRLTEIVRTDRAELFERCPTLTFTRTGFFYQVHCVRVWTR